MDSKNLRKKILTRVSQGLIGMTLLGLTACATPSKTHYQVLDREGRKTDMYIEEKIYKSLVQQERTVELPNRKGFYVQRDILDGCYPILDTQGKKTGLYLEEKAYREISAQKKLIEIPTLKGFYVQIGSQVSEGASSLEKKVGRSTIIEEDITDQVRESLKKNTGNSLDPPFFSVKKEESPDQVSASSKTQMTSGAGAAASTEREEVENPIKINYKKKAIILSPEKKVKKPVIKEDLPEPVIIDSEFTSSRYYHLFDEKGKKIGLYIEDDLYKKISKQKRNGESVKIPSLEGIYLKAGQGGLTSFLNTFASGGNYMSAYLNGGVVEGIYVSEPKMREVCWKKDVEEEQPYDGRFEKVPGTSLEIRCALFHAPEKGKDIGGGGGDGGGGGGK